MKKVILSSFALLLAMLLVGCTTTEEQNPEQIQEPEKTGIDYLVLVNKQHKLPEDWEANLELVEVQNAYDETIKVEKEALEKYYELREDLLKDWVDIELDSVYRSVAKQEEIWAEFEEKYGIDYTKKYVATPGYSEHHTALALDICIIKDWVLIYENDDMIAEKEIFDKIHKKLADHGFILRYLEGKEEITGYGYEPWHLRYVWDVNVAKEIMDNGLTFEEYLGNKGVINFDEDFCEAHEWTVSTEKTETCEFSDGTSCEIKAFINHECDEEENTEETPEE